MNVISHMIRFMTVLSLVFLTATTSANTAERVKFEQLQNVYLALGFAISADDFCSDEGHDLHDCPLCHKIERASLANVMPTARIVVFDLDHAVDSLSLTTRQSVHLRPWVRGPPFDDA